MAKAPWLLLWASVPLMLFGILDRLTPTPFFDGVAAGTYWKGAMALLLYAVAIRLIKSE